MNRIIEPTQSEMALYGKKTRADALLTKEIGELEKPKTLADERGNDYLKSIMNGEAEARAEITRQVEFCASVANYFTPVEFSSFVMDKNNPKHQCLVVFYVEHFMIREYQANGLNPENDVEFSVNHRQAYKTLCKHFKVDPNDMNEAWQRLYTFFKTRGIFHYYTREIFFNETASSSAGWNKLISTT